MLLIHGMAGSSETWRAVLPRLAKKYRVVAPDLLGHGQSAKPRGDYSLGAFAVWLRDFLDELGITHATIVGHSLGGGVAMQFCTSTPTTAADWSSSPAADWAPTSARSCGYCRPPEPSSCYRSSRLAPCSTSATSCGRGVGGSIAAGGTGPDRQTRQSFLKTLCSVVDHRGQAVSALNRLKLRADLPVMAIWGDSDGIIPVDHAYAAQKARQDSRLEVLPGIGHFPQVEAPFEVVDLIEDFVSAADRATVASEQPQP